MVVFHLDSTPAFRSWIEYRIAKKFSRTKIFAVFADLDHTTETQELKAEIGIQAAEHGVAATVRFCAQKLPDHVLKESSVRTWMNTYTREMQTRGRKP